MIKELNKRRLALKAKLRSGKKVFAAWTSFGHPQITEIFCRMNPDFVGIDIEHSTISQEQSQRIIAASQSCGSLCLPRIATHNNEAIKRLLDSGADGLIVPNVDEACQVEKIISWMKYPPQGRRGFGVARAQGYGFDFEANTKTWNKTSILIAQIESIQAVENIASILQFDEIDAVMVGPYDISGSLGIPGKIEHLKVKQAAKKVIQACKKYKKGCGTQDIDPDKVSLKRKFAEGYSFVVLASDIFLLWKWTDSMKKITNYK